MGGGSHKMTLNSLMVVGMPSLGMLMTDIGSRDTELRITGNPPERVKGSMGIVVQNIDVEMKTRRSLTDPVVSTSIIESGQQGKILISKKKRRNGVSIEIVIFELFPIRVAEFEL